MKISLDCFNSADGVGLFTGVARYNVLEQRLPLAAIKARDMFGLWSSLLRMMRWPVPPKAADAKIAEALLVSDPAKVIRTLASEAQAVVSMARMLHDADKNSRKALRAEIYAAKAELEAPDFDDSLEGI